MTRSWSSRLVVALGLLFGVAGCPMTFEDDFRTVAADGSTGATSTGEQPSDAGAGMAATEGGRGGTSSSTAGSPAVGGSDSGGGGAGATSALGGDGPGEAGAGGSASDPCAQCLPAETCCDGECVDLRYDSKNCRACGQGCPGTTCDNSSCTNTCALGFVDCNRNVVDGCEINPATDPENCGNCGIVCGFQLVCEGGNCVCPSGTADCDGLKDNGCETDTTSDAANCGACGKSCGAHQVCGAGSCECGPDFADCNLDPVDGCEASLAADSTCGSCDFDCGPHGKCLGPATCGCAGGYQDCDLSAPGCETPLADPDHCGSCLTVCQDPTPACDGTSCNLGCGDLTACGASCVDTQTDPQHCGGCNQPVGPNQVCVNGQPECAAGYGDCDSNPADCEVNTQTSSANCGACGNSCKSGALCTSGSCGCAPATPNDCGASCQQCCNNAQCSDGNSCTADVCNNGTCSSGAVCEGGGKCCAGTGCFACCSDADCTGGKVCSNNQCITLVCAPPLVACNQKCVNPITDAKNCGSCGYDCGPGRSCASSSCTPHWVKTTDPLLGFASREKAAYAAMGDKVFIWGGSDAADQDLADGAVYDPKLDSWAAVGNAGTPPSARVLATAVWTGSVMVVWGGGNEAASADYTSGGRYDPTTGSWQPISTVNAPNGRRGSYGFWTGSRVLIYGGEDRFGNASSSLALYDPVNDVWSSTTNNSVPSGRNHPVVGWTGSVLYLYGGLLGGGGTSDRTYAYDVVADTWDNLSNGPSSRYGALGTWDGAYLTAWSGNTSNGLKTDGKFYAPPTDKWSGLSTSGDPSARWAPNRQTGWSARIKPGVTLVLGGQGGFSTFYTDGALYSSTTNTWSSVSSWPSAASHRWGVGVWTGSEFVLWGGRSGSGSSLTSAGDRYRP